MSYLVIGLAGQRRAIAVGAVLEVFRAPTIARVPAGPPPVRGLAAVRGRLVPVIGLTAEPASGAVLLVIVGVGGRPLALIVDRVEGVVAAGDGLPEIIDLENLENLRSAA